MLLINWDDLPTSFKNKDVRFYYDILNKKRFSLIVKRVFDIMLSLTLLVLLLPIITIISILIKCDSPGEIFFKQTRVTQFGREFKIFKFRTMIQNAHNLGPSVTPKDDCRMTRVGKLIRSLRMDEIPQLINIFLGQMSFVGTRPEVPKYVKEYNNEMMATLLLPAGLTSLASIKFKDESEILYKFSDKDKAYVDLVLNEKMKINLQYIKDLSFFYDFKIMIMTLIAVVKR